MENLTDASRALLKKHTTITMLAEAMIWCREAEEKIAQLAEAVNHFETHIQELVWKSKELRQAAKKQSFLRYFFKTSEEKSVLALQRDERRIMAIQASLIEQLQEKMDLTPCSKEEQILLLKELKSMKKELQLQKKEINAEMKSIRTEARKKSADAATSFTALLTQGKYTAAERRSIRAQKESAIAPHEDAKAMVDRQILSIERKILHVESFS